MAARSSQGFGWAIAKALAEAGAEISLGVWVRPFTAIRMVHHRHIIVAAVRCAIAIRPCQRPPPVRCAQVPALNIFESSLRRGKFDDSRKLSDGSLMEFSHIYPMDAVYDTPEDVPQEVNAPPQQHMPVY